MFKKLIKFKLFALILILGFSPLTRADDFTDGVVKTNIGSQDILRSMKIDSSGRIVVAGYTQISSGYDFAAVRYTSDGELDTSFGDSGKVITDLGGNDYAQSVVIDYSGRIVVAGFTQNSGYYDFAVVRYTSDGELDTSFGGGDGIVITDLGYYSDTANSVVVDSSNKIIVAGYTGTSTNYNFAVVRYKSNGDLDTTFGGSGKVITDLGKNDLVYSMAIIDSSKSIIVAGSSGTNFAVALYNSTGELDTDFGGDGIVIADMGYSSDSASSVAINSSGKIIVAGFTGTSTNYNFAVLQYNSDGSLDTSFGGTGHVITDLDGYSDYPQSIVIDSSKNIIVAGYTETDIGYDFALVRYKSNGSLDTSFGDGGKVMTYIDDEDFGLSVGIDSSKNTIIVAGHNIYEFVLASYKSDGSLNVDSTTGGTDTSGGGVSGGSESGTGTGETGTSGGSGDTADFDTTEGGGGGCQLTTTSGSIPNFSFLILMFSSLLVLAVRMKKSGAKKI